MKLGNIQLHNSWRYEGEDWWSWSAYITGSDLSNVSCVQYILHPTFRQPVRKIQKRETGFRLDTEGWGTFPLKAIVQFKDGTEQILTRSIILKYEPKLGCTD
jgi:transcription initiation factor IIF auxiliary subunit